MTKVKIVQIALALSEDESNAEYLDDKGRVWYQVRVNPPAGEIPYEWQQLDLPDEPTAGKE